jgi:hypothetical protein
MKIRQEMDERIIVSMWGLVCYLIGLFVGRRFQKKGDKMTDLEKAIELARKHDGLFGARNREECCVAACQEMAEWKEQQMVELWNVARNVYEAWMGGTMDDVRECMKDLGHVFYEFKN